LVGLTLVFAARRLSTLINHFLYYNEAFLGGMILGILLLLIISGEFLGASSGVDDAKKAGSKGANIETNPDE